MATASMASAPVEQSVLYTKVYGCLVGGLIGDAMGSPAEGKTYQQIQQQFGEIVDFQGAGTDDTAIRQQLCDAIIQSNGDVTADEFAASFLKFKDQYYRLWWIPVKNMFHKIESKLALPVDAGWGNMHSSSSAMAISPMGIINACQPRLAAMETFDVAGLIHSGASGFCRDAACGMAAAIAEAFKPGATVDSIIDAGTRYLHPVSSAQMIEQVQRALALAREAKNYALFRERFYAAGLRDIIADARETFPVTLALFYLAKGEVNTALRMAANFGRDADTIATMVGGLAGAFGGVQALQQEWVAQVEANPDVQYKPLARRLVEIVLAKAERRRRDLDTLQMIAA
jgi:ADP-ribosylglycohydrolase